MKNLKLLLLTLLSVISFNLFSQTQVYTTNTTGPNICDGTAVLDTTNINMTSIYWQGMGMIINQGSYIVTNLCPGTYGVTFISNGTSVTLTFIVMAGNFNPCLNFGGFITPTNSIDSTTCDGIVTATVTGGQAPYTYLWSNGNMFQTIDNLCPGTYCCYVTDSYGCTITLCDTIGVQSSNYGDTLYITNEGMCNFPIGTLVSTIEDCKLNYNSIGGAFISDVTPISDTLNIVMVTWILVDTNGFNVSTPQYQTYTYIPTVGCYNLQLIIFCYQKSMNYNTIVINQNWYVGFAGINELSGNGKQLISVVDLMGKETNIQPNKHLIYTYSDGSKDIRYIKE